jgi:hypothetical protein
MIGNIRNAKLQPPSAKDNQILQFDQFPVLDIISSAVDPVGSPSWPTSLRAVIVIKKPQNSTIDDDGFLDWDRVCCASNDDFLTLWNSFCELGGVLGLNYIEFTCHNEGRSFDVAEIIECVVRLRLPHFNDLAVERRPMSWVWCEKSITKGRVRYF